MICRQRDGSAVEIHDAQGKVVSRFYDSIFSEITPTIAAAPWISKLAGRYLDSHLSAHLVRSFVKRNKIDLSEYPARKYHSFNDFFTRQINQDHRPVDKDEDRLISPCDGKLTVLKLQEDTHFTIKGRDYTLKSFLKNDELSKKFCGGWGVLIRLSVDNYHRYCWPVSGHRSDFVRINGVYHTVNPIAAESRAIYAENTREYSVVRTEDKRNVLMMEIGALLVGRIVNPHCPYKVIKGTEKGYFEFGGSSIMLLLEKDGFAPDEDLVLNSFSGEETIVKMGESIGNLL